jgi:hypothetical protein
MLSFRPNKGLKPKTATFGRGGYLIQGQFGSHVGGGAMPAALETAT